MAFWRGVKRRVKATVPALALLAVAGYFGWNATQGDRGLKAYARQQDQLHLAQAELTRVNAEVDGWEHRVAELRTNRLDPDMLDERARSVLSVSQPNEIVVLWGKKLF